MTEGKQLDNTGSKTANDVLIEHADRMWQSECENAARLANQIQVLAGGTIALLGLGLFGFKWLAEAPSKPVLNTSVTIILTCLLTISLLLFVAVLISLYSREHRPSQQESESEGSGRQAPVASAEWLEITGDDAEKPTKTIVFKKTYWAYTDLKQRNANQRLKLVRGERFLAGAIICIFLAILLYLWASLPARIGYGLESAHHEPDSKQNLEPAE
jgi:Ca2+/Na+ antiporter